MIRCPKCKYEFCRVTDVRYPNNKYVTMRKRKCLNCGYTFKTKE